MSKEKRHEPKGRDIKEKGNEKLFCLPLHTETEESRARLCMWPFCNALQLAIPP